MSYIVSPDCVACDVQGGIAILNLKTNLYFGLDDVGADVWANLQKPQSLVELAQIISTNYDVAQIDCEADISHLLQEMSHNGLIVSA